MRRLLALVLIALNVGSSAVAQDYDALWRQLEGIDAGSKIRLTLRDGARLEGLLVEVQTDALVLDNTRLLKGTVRSSAGSRLGGTMTFLRTDVVQLRGPRAESAGRSVGKTLAIAGIVAGLIFVLSPAGRCITSSTGC